MLSITILMLNITILMLSITILMLSITILMFCYNFKIKEPNLLFLLFMFLLNVILYHNQFF